MSDTPTTEADSYGLVIPQPWVEIPLDDDGFATFTRDIVGRLRATEGWDRTAERRLELLISQLRNDIAVGQVRLAAVWTQGIDGRDGKPTVMVTGLAVSRLDSSELVATVTSVSTDQLVAGLAQAAPGEPGERRSDIEPPRKIVLAHAGEAVRLKRLYERELSILEKLRIYTQSYLVPHDAGAAICLVQFSTLNIEEASLLDELFDAIAQTLRIFKPGDSTDFGESLLEPTDV